MFRLIHSSADRAHTAACAAVAVVLVLLPWSLFGQTTGTILGQVADPSGAAILGAEVEGAEHGHRARASNH